MSNLSPIPVNAVIYKLRVNLRLDIMISDDGATSAEREVGTWDLEVLPSKVKFGRLWLLSLPVLLNSVLARACTVYY